MSGLLFKVFWVRYRL